MAHAPRNVKCQELTRERSSYRPRRVIDLEGFAYALVSEPAPGLITYVVIDFKEVVGALVLFAIRARLAQMDAAVTGELLLETI